MYSLTVLGFIDKDITNSLYKLIPNLDTSAVTNMSYTFANNPLTTKSFGYPNGL